MFNLLRILRIDKEMDITDLDRWCEALNVANMIIANDSIANDEPLSTVIKLSGTPHLKMAIKEVKEAAVLLEDRMCEQVHVALVVNNLKDALYILKSTDRITHVFMGKHKLTKDDPAETDWYEDIRKEWQDLDLFHEIINLAASDVYQAEN